MTDAIEQYFEALGRRGHEPLVGNFSGRVRFEILDGVRTDYWTLVIERGRLDVSHRRGKPGCTIRGERQLFDLLVTGYENPMAATLRGALICTGDVDLLLAVQRLFPGPPAGAARPVRSGSA
jgi:hypothetical protein